MKPLKLEVFPPLSPFVRAILEMYPYPWQVGILGLDPNVHMPGLFTRKDKRLTDAELAAEYHQQDAYTEYWMGRTTATHTATNQDRLATLHRFATLPSYDQEDNDV